jgi:glutamate synthase domain-containing protein 2
MLALVPRFAVFGICVALSLIAPLAAQSSSSPIGWWLLAVTMWSLTGLGVWDIFQTRHAILRNYPIIGHLRYIFEESGPALRQYFFEDDHDETPFSRADRSLVYQRAKQEIDKRPFGTQLDVYSDRYEWINHSMTPSTIKDSDFRIVVGGPDCTKPVSLSVLNISAMSFGALSANAILALNQGARTGNFAHDTGEGGISRYHREHGGDLIWNIGSGYFGCRDSTGRFSEEHFIENATRDQVKMIEIKLSQGAKPGHGGILPGGKVTAEIAAARGVQIGQDCNSPAAHAEFHSPIELLEFVARLRRLSGGKPVGFKLCIGHAWEWFAIAKAMVKTGITPDFIVVDGAEGGTGAAPIEFVDHVGTPLREAIRLVHNTLVGLNLRDRIKLGASGKVISAFDMMRVFALGADWCNSARAFMFAIGCIQAQQCHTGRCPTGVATQDPDRQRALVPEEKSVRVAQFHHNTLHALAELLQAAGLEHPKEVTTNHIAQRKVDDRVALMSDTYKTIAPGSLLTNTLSGRVFEVCWPMANPDSFKPLESLPERLTHA